MSVAGLLLAGGAGRRMGGPKALVRLGGDFLVDRGSRTLVAAGCVPVLVVLGARADDVRRDAGLSGVRVVDNPGWPEGMGSSLRAGLSALEGEADVEAAVVTLVDQPHVGVATVRRLVDAWQATAAPAAVATYDGEPRNPVLLDRASWGEVAASAVGDRGARAWLRSAPGVVRVACEDTGTPDDLDTPADLETAVAGIGRTATATASTTTPTTRRTPAD